jgi:putative FmdB family regulatory protein
MPTYEYECKKCGQRFERVQSITDEPLGECPECGNRVKRLINGGIGFIVGEGKYQHKDLRKNNCSLEQAGITCCGRDIKCNTPPCEDK